MIKIIKRILSIVLAVSVMLTATLTTYALEEEVYLSDLRIIYAEDYSEAKTILKESTLKDYKVLKENLNEDSDEIGVWLAYKTSTDIEDAITDLSIMQMDGGYNEGNYQKMIEQSRSEYLEMGKIYADAISYFAKAYDAQHFLAKSAYRQLNFYTVKTEENIGLEVPEYEGESLGKIFYDGVDASGLATMFMEGNKYALQNIRSLIAMGVSYNEDGKTYLQKVADEAAKMNANPNVYINKNYRELASIIAGVIVTYTEMFKELEAYEDELDYTDETMSELELKYSEYKSIADRMREVNYLNGKTLYDFCLEYKRNESDYSTLYPLVAALNKGQEAMTKVSHYYDVVRYSMSDYPEDVIEEELAKLEETYSENPFNIYEGVDRSIYSGTFALTSAAFRSDAYTESGFSAFLTSGLYGALGISGIVVGSVGVSLFVWAICRSVKAGMMKSAASKAVEAANQAYTNYYTDAVNAVASKNFAASISNSTSMLESLNLTSSATYDDVANALIDKYMSSFGNSKAMALDVKLKALHTEANIDIKEISGAFKTDIEAYKTVTEGLNKEVTTMQATTKTNLEQAQAMSQQTADLASSMSGVTIALYIVGGIMMLYSAITLTISIYNYYHPDYDDIPASMVDLIETEDGDRYIKYDVVREVEMQENGEYAPGDLNAFEGQRWNALYYTKSYEAGKPLLADEFYVSNTNNKPKSNYAPVHRFGEVVSYDLNKYNYDGDTSIYLSVKQSENNKAAVENVPELIGSMFGTGYILLAGGIGAMIGVVGTLGTQTMIKKRKKETE